MNPAMQREAPRENSTLNHVRCIFNESRYAMRGLLHKAGLWPCGFMA